MQTVQDFHDLYVALRKKLIRPAVFDISPLIISFLSLAFAVMSAHFFNSSSFALAGVLIIFHGVTEMWNSEIVERHGISDRNRLLREVLKHVSEIVIVIGIGMNPQFTIWPVLVLLGSIALFHHIQTQVGQQDDTEMDTYLLARGSFVIFLATGAILEEFLADAVVYAVGLITLLYIYLALQLLFTNLPEGPSEEKEA